MFYFIPPAQDQVWVFDRCRNPLKTNLPGIFGASADDGVVPVTGDLVLSPTGYSVRRGNHVSASSVARDIISFNA